MADKIAVRRLSDIALIECFQKVAAADGNEGASASITTFGAVSISFQPDSASDSEELQAVLDAKAYVISQATLTINGLLIRYYRGGQAEPKSAFVDELQIQNNNNSKLSKVEILQAVSILTRELVTLPTLKQNDIDSEDNVIALHSASLERLERLNEELIRNTDQYRKDLDKQFNDKLEKKEELLQQQKQVSEKEFQEKLRELEEKSHALDVERSALDASSNTHARRQIRRDILEAIKARQEEFKLTTGTISKRLPVTIAMGTLALFFGGLAILAAPGFYSAVQGDSILLLAIAAIKQTFYVLGAVTTVLYFIRWQNRWFEQHASAEFKLKQFELDMERASWIVESSLEWKAEKDSDMPDSLVSTLSSGLFDHSDDRKDNLIHPSDQLASALLGTASSIKLKTGDSEIQVNPKKLRKTSLIDEGS